MEELVKMIATDHVTLKFHPLLISFNSFNTDFTQGAKITFCKAVLDNNYSHNGFL
jgi:hypothetical protein